MSNGYHDGQRTPHPEWQGSSRSDSPPPPPLADGVDLTQLVQALRRQIPFIFLMGVAVFLVVMAYTASSRMEFTSSGRLFLGEVGDRSARESRGIDLSAGGQSEITSEIEIMRSRTIIKKAILAAGTNVEISPPDWEAPRYWKWRFEDRDISMLDTASRQLLATDSFLDPGIRDDRTYTVVFRTEMKYDLLSDEGEQLGTGGLGTPLKVSGVTLMLQPGAKASPTPGSEFYVTVYPVEDVTDWVLNQLDVSAPEPSGGEPAKVVALEYRSDSPRQAAVFLRSLMNEYLDLRQSWKTENATAVERFVKKQLQGMQSSLDQTQEKLADYRAKNDVVVSEGEAQSMVHQVASYEEQRVKAKLLVSHLNSVKAALRQKNPPVEAFMFGEADDAVLQGMASSLSQAQQQLTELRGKFKAAAPDVQQQRAKVQAQLAMIRNYVKSRLSRAEEQLRQLNGVIGSYRKRLRTLPGAELGLAQIGRESEVYGRMYSSLLEQQQQTAMLKASTVSKNRILDHPQIPFYESSPRLALRVASGLVGLLLGAFLVIARSLLTTALRSDAEARSVVGGVPVFASVPNQVTPEVRAGQPPTPMFDVLAGGLENFGFAEAFRTLRTNLYYTLREGHGQVILVTSSTPGDGKTTTALSLGAMLAADSKRTLVIDTDLRKPSHHELTDRPLRPGLGGLLSGRHSWKEVTRPVHVSLGHFDSISAGVGASIELLSSGQLAKFLIDARSRYDYIILDCAAYPLVSDTLVLANLADFVLSVVRIGNTPRRLAEEHFRGLAGFAQRQGVLINNSETANVQIYPYPARPPRFGEKDKPAGASGPPSGGERVH